MVAATIDHSSVVRMKSVSHKYRFEDDYFKVRDLPKKNYVASPTFLCGGYEWAIHYYPQYMSTTNDQYLALVFLSNAKHVSAESCFILSNKTGVSSMNFHNHIFNENKKKCGINVNKRHVENKTGIDGIFIITCTIRVLTERRNEVSASSDGMQEHIGQLLERGKKFDVTFEVEGNKISAHKLILAARSPVIKAELFGSMAEADMPCIKIEDIKAEVFNAMLRFICMLEFKRKF